MKRLLSTILALAMLISLVPTAFATDTTTETEMDYSGITVKYNWGQCDVYTLTGLNPANITFNDTKGFWDFYSALALGSNSTVTSGRLKLIGDVNNWVALEIYVPKAGRYNVLHDYGRMKAKQYGTDKAGLWILPLINAETGVEYTKNEITDALTEKTWQTGSIDFYNDGATSTVSISNEAAGHYDFSEAGSYLVVYKALQASSEATDGRAYMFPTAITLDGVEGEETNPIPMTLPVSADKTEIVVGSEDNSTAQMTATAYMSDGTAAAEGYTVTYASSDNNIATVDEKGLVTAVSYGTATITATSTIDGYTISGSKEITVNNPNGVKVEYNVASLAVANEETGFLTYLTKDNTNGFYRYYGMATRSATDPSKPEDHLDISGDQYIRLHGASALAFEVYVPKSDYYTMEMEYSCQSRGRMAGVFLGKAEELTLAYGSPELGKQIGTYLCYTGGTGNLSISGVWIDEGWNTISFTADETAEAPSGVTWGNYIWIGDFTLVSGSGTLPMSAIVKMDKTTLTLNDTDNTATISGAVQCSSDGTVLAQSEDATTYESSDTSVVTVSGTTITAVGTGAAEITAKIGEGDNEVTAKRTVTVVDKAATDEVETVQFMATSTLADNAGVTTNISSYTVGETTDEIDPGKTVKVTASDVEGYIFRGWKRGSEDNGVWVSESKTYSFPLLTNTYLTAIYDVDTATGADVNVEFYNFNGQFLASRAVDGAQFVTLASGVTPTLTGYNSYFWTIDGENAISDDKVFDKLTRVVAKFTDTQSFAVTVPANVTSSKASGTYAYDTEIVMTAENAGFWKVNGETVAYGTNYTYCVWSAAAITFEEAENDNKPILSIDDNATDGARMISYDANGAEIVEVGILFGANAKINSANSRAVSREAKTNLKGQFTAKPYDSGDVNAATAYLIYNDNGTYRVIYAD